MDLQTAVLAAGLVLTAAILVGYVLVLRRRVRDLERRRASLEREDTARSDR